MRFTELLSGISSFANISQGCLCADDPLYHRLYRPCLPDPGRKFILQGVKKLIDLTDDLSQQKRLFHIITAFITAFAAISYFAMATGDGISLVSYVIKETHKHNIPTETHIVYRAVYWARYVDWSLTTPLLLLDLSFLAGLNGANIIVTIIADLIMILTGLFAAFGHGDSQKWGNNAGSSTMTI